MQGRSDAAMQEQAASPLLVSHPDVNCSCDLRRDCMGSIMQLLSGFLLRGQNLDMGSGISGVCSH